MNHAEINDLPNFAVLIFSRFNRFPPTQRTSIKHRSLSQDDFPLKPSSDADTAFGSISAAAVLAEQELRGRCLGRVVAKKYAVIQLVNFENYEN